MPDFHTYESTDDANTASAPEGMPTGSPPSAVSPAIRSLQGSARRFFDHISPTATTTGSANAYVVTYSPPVATLIGGDRFAFKTNFTNTGAATLDVGPGATSITRLDGSALQSGDMPTGCFVEVAFDGTNFRLLNPPTVLGSASISGANLGSLTVTGASTLTGNVSAGGTLSVTGATTLAGLSASGVAVSGALTLGTPLAVSQGGTGGTTQSAAQSGLGLGSAATHNIGTSGSNVPLLNGANSWGGSQAGAVHNIGPTSGAITIDLSQGNLVDLLINGNVTSLTFSNVTAGQSGRINIIYSGGSWTIGGLSSNFRFAGGTTPTFTSTANKIDKLVYDIRSTTAWDANLISNFTL